MSWVPGPSGRLPEVPERPTEGSGGLPRGPRTSPGPGSKNIKTNTFCRTLLRGRAASRTPLSESLSKGAHGSCMLKLRTSRTFGGLIVLPGWNSNIFSPQPCRLRASRPCVNIVPPLPRNVLLPLLRKTGPKPGSSTFSGQSHCDWRCGWHGLRRDCSDHCFFLCLSVMTRLDRGYPDVGGRSWCSSWLWNSDGGYCCRWPAERRKGSRNRCKDSSRRPDGQALHKRWVDTVGRAATVAESISRFFLCW